MSEERVILEKIYSFRYGNIPKNLEKFRGKVALIAVKEPSPHTMCFSMSDDGIPFFFDPRGKHWSYYEELTPFFEKLPAASDYNKYEFQKDSNLCAIFCAYFVKGICKGQTPSEIIQEMIEKDVDDKYMLDCSSKYKCLENASLFYDVDENDHAVTLADIKEAQKIPKSEASSKKKMKKIAQMKENEQPKERSRKTTTKDTGNVGHSRSKSDFYKNALLERITESNSETSGKPSVTPQSTLKQTNTKTQKNPNSEASSTNKMIENAQTKKNEQMKKSEQIKKNEQRKKSKQRKNNEQEMCAEIEKMELGDNTSSIQQNENLEENHKHSSRGT